MGAIAPVRAQVLAGAPRVDGEEGGQDLRHRRRQGRDGAGPPAAAAGLAGARARAQRQQLARAARAQQGREDVPPLQERRAAHQVSARAQREHTPRAAPSTRPALLDHAAPEIIVCSVRPCQTIIRQTAPASSCVVCLPCLAPADPVQCQCRARA